MLQMRTCGAAATCGEQLKSLATVSPLCIMWRTSATVTNNANHKLFTSSPSFKLQPCQVNESNIPTAREVTEMIATRKELHQQLPTARELEALYVRPPPSGSGPTGCSAPCEAPLWPDSDTAEEIMDEERYECTGTTDGLQTPSPAHVLLAWRALMWGTLYALLGVTAVVLLAMYASGMNSVSSVLHHLRSRPERELLRLAAEGHEVRHYVLDLANPITLGKQMQELWQVVQDAAKGTDDDDGKDAQHRQDC
uniref:Transmembrane protein 242 n=1 Tax=Trypanosoma congolense (strain IL3000) TaxID=1068625 RepID=G0UPI8_TRYCI|nr:conserved hypothetical protein [Trypanosoma congolense IL3000]